MQVSQGEPMTSVDRELQREDLALRKSGPQGATLISGEEDIPDGGGRFTWRLGAVVVVSLIGLALVGIIAVDSHRPSSSQDEHQIQIGTVGDASFDPLELASEAKPPTSSSAPSQAQSPAIIMQKAQQPAQTSVSPPVRMPSPAVERARDLYRQAVESPPVLEAFHQGQAKEIATQQTTSTAGAGLLKAPPSPYLVAAGSVVPAVLVTGVSSELPSQIIAQVRENVFDTASGRWLLIPQGTRLLGSFNSPPAYAQTRIQIAWRRLIFPDTASMDLPDMPGTDSAGYAGFKDQVNNHVLKTYGSALLVSLIGAGQAVGQMAAYGQAGPGYGGYGNPNTSGLSTVTGAAGAGVSQQFGQLGSEQVRRGMLLPPTIDIRPGYQFNVMVTGDLIFPGPYRR
jgi:type IV secretion system protein VirB10